MGEVNLLDPCACRGEFFVERLEKVEKGEAKSSLRRHDGGCSARVWLVTWPDTVRNHLRKVFPGVSPMAGQSATRPRQRVLRSRFTLRD